VFEYNYYILLLQGIKIKKKRNYMKKSRINILMLVPDFGSIAFKLVNL